MNQDNPNKKKSLASTFSLVAVVTVLSKVAGLFRDIVLLQYFGTSVVSDAFNYANLFTGNFFILFGGLGGPFHTSSVTILTKLKTQRVKLEQVLQQIFVITLVLLSLISILIYFLAPSIVRIIADCSHHDNNFKIEFWNMTIYDLRIMLPMIIIAGLIGIAYGLMNILDKYFLPSISPALSSLALIVCVIFFSKDFPSQSLAYGTLIGAVLQLLLQFDMWQYLKFDFKYLKNLFFIDQSTKDYFKMLWPAAIGTSVGQLNIYVDSFFTSQLHVGSWTAIVNANRLVQLPLGVLLTAMLVPILPRFTSYVNENNISQLKIDFAKSLRILWFFSIPMAVLLFVLKNSVIEILYKRGAFDNTSEKLMVEALTYLLPSIFFYVARDLITRVFYAFQDTKTPYYIGIFAIFTNFIFDYLLIRPLGIGGITLSTTIVTLINMTILAILISKKVGSLNIERLIRPLAIMLISATFSGVFCFFVYNICCKCDGFVLKIITNSVLAVISLALYLAICYLLKLEEINFVLEFLAKIKMKITN